MRPKYALSLFTVVSSLLGLHVCAFAGTLGWTLNFAGGGPWTGYIQAPSGHTTSELSCGAIAAGTQTHSSQSRTGTIMLTVRWIRPSANTSDLPPTSVTPAYTASTTGHLQYSFLGRTPPSGQGSGDYSGTVTRLGASTKTVSDSFGPVYQQTTYQGLGFAPHTEDCSSSQSLSTPLSAWAKVDDGTTTTYSITFTLSTQSGSATADCTVNWKTSNTQADWFYDFDVTGFNVT